MKQFIAASCCTLALAYLFSAPTLAQNNISQNRVNHRLHQRGTSANAIYDAALAMLESSSFKCLTLQPATMSSHNGKGWKEGTKGKRTPDGIAPGWDKIEIFTSGVTNTNSVPLVNAAWQAAREYENEADIDWDAVEDAFNDAAAAAVVGTMIHELLHGCCNPGVPDEDPVSCSHLAIDNATRGVLCALIAECCAALLGPPDLSPAESGRKKAIIAGLRVEVGVVERKWKKDAEKANNCLKYGMPGAPDPLPPPGTPPTPYMCPGTITGCAACDGMSPNPLVPTPRIPTPPSGMACYGPCPVDECPDCN